MAGKKSYKSNAKKAARAAKKHPKAVLVLAVLLVIIVAAVLILWVLKPELFHKYLGTGGHFWTEWEVTRQADCGNGSKSRECLYCDATEDEIIKGSGNHEIDETSGICGVCGYNSNAEELSIHFLELGNKYTGDCTLIKCGNTEVLIDAGSRKNSASAIRSYIDEYCEDGKLDYVIATHAHQDHIAGFVGTKDKSGKQSGVLYNYEIGTIIQFAGHNTTSTIYKDYVKAVDHAKENGAQVYTAKECCEKQNGAKDIYYLDENKTVSLKILKSHYYYNETNDENDYSVCVLLTQKGQNGAKDKNFLFTGDLEKKGESYLVDMNDLPEVELFKGGHHGSYTASTEKLLEAIKPKNVAVCCCCGTTEYTSAIENTFPAQAFIDRVAKYTENIYCTTLMLDYKAGEYTSMNGNIIFYSYNGELQVKCSNNDIVLKDTEWFKKNRVWP